MYAVSDILARHGLVCSRSFCGMASAQAETLDQCKNIPDIENKREASDHRRDRSPFCRSNCRTCLLRLVDTPYLTTILAQSAMEKCSGGLSLIRTLLRLSSCLMLVGVLGFLRSLSPRRRTPLLDQPTLSPESVIHSERGSGGIEQRNA